MIAARPECRSRDPQMSVAAALVLLACIARRTPARSVPELSDPPKALDKFDILGKPRLAKFGIASAKIIGR